MGRCSVQQRVLRGAFFLPDGTQLQAGRLRSRVRPWTARCFTAASRVVTKHSQAWHIYRDISDSMTRPESLNATSVVTASPTKSRCQHTSVTPTATTDHMNAVSLAVRTAARAKAT